MNHSGIYGTFFQNDPVRPLVYGEVNLINPPRRRLRGEPEKEGILVHPVIVGFCGTDHELMMMGKRGQLGPKFPAGQNRLINGHEGVVWVPSQNRFAIVLIRGGDSVDPTRYTEDETYFEYGCDQADGLFCDSMYVNPDMLLEIPEGHVHDGRLDLSFAKKMVFPDPFSCMLFQLERMEDLGSAHWFRQTARRLGCGEEEARAAAKDEIFERTVIFGLGTTGMFIGDIIRQAHPDAKIVFDVSNYDGDESALVTGRVESRACTMSVSSFAITARREASGFLSSYRRSAAGLPPSLLPRTSSKRGVT